MTLVLCGLTYEFERLVALAEYAYEQGALSLPVVIQGPGLSKRGPATQGAQEHAALEHDTAQGQEYSHIQYIDSVSRRDYQKLLHDADLVITHAGVGSILGARDAAHPFVIVPRSHSLGEHVNDHQIDTLRAFESAGYLEGLSYASYYPEQSPDDFVSCIKAVQSMASAKTKAAKSGIVQPAPATHKSLIARILEQENLSSQGAALKGCVETGQGLMLSASAGGHMVELVAAMGYKRFSDERFEAGNREGAHIVWADTLVSTMSIGEGELPARSYELLLEGNRNNPLRMLRNVYKSFAILRKHKPELLITSGALPSAILARMAVWRGIHVIWIDSISAVQKLTLSGRWVRRFARVYVQWEPLADGKQTFYCGSLFD